MNNNWSHVVGVADAGRARYFICCAAGLLAAVVILFICASADYWPEAPGITIYENGGTTVDASHSDQGYIMVKHKKSSKRLKLRISLGKATLTYDLNRDGEFEVFPLQLGDGKYKVQVFENVSGKKYSTASTVAFNVKVEDPLLPFLYPSQYIWYTPDSMAVAKGRELCEGLTTESEKVGAIYHFMIDHFTYDYVRAEEVQTNTSYLPVVDSVLEEKKGICFDISAMVACMLRTQNIPVQMVIGYADKTYHAWNNILVDGKWYRYDVTADIVAGDVKKYTPEKVY